MLFNKIYERFKNYKILGSWSIKKKKKIGAYDGYIGHEETEV
jgi:hypothetical protein